ncbi:MAG: SRPBCC family protein [Chloroflexota bacterium]
MGRIDCVIDVAAPITLVFAAVTDPKRSVDWNPHIIEVSNLSSYPVVEGTTWQQVVSAMGQTLRVNCRVSLMKAPMEGVLQVDGPQRARIITRCSRIGKLTHVEQSVEYDTGKGVAGAMAARIVQPFLRREVEHSLQRMRRDLEIEAASEPQAGTAS